MSLPRSFDIKAKVRFFLLWSNTEKIMSMIGGCKMDPISLIEGALVAEAAASAKDTAGQAVKDA
jgi:hypothetical protein